MAERRGSERLKAFLKGTLYFHHGRSSVDCLIRDLSATGARLLVPDNVKIPKLFELHVSNQPEPLPARMKWRRDDEIGVSFVEAKRCVRNADRPEDVERRMAALELQIEGLRAELLTLRVRPPLLKKTAPPQAVR
jgi:PilZ domain-containing protein